MVQKQRIKKGFGLTGKQRARTRSFVQQVGQNTEGISAIREKFIHDMTTGAHKVLSPE